MSTFEEIAAEGRIPLPAMPDAVGQPIRLRGYGGEVRRWMVEADVEAEVIGFTAKGFPYLKISGAAVTNHCGRDSIMVADRSGCAVRVDANGSVVYA